MGVYTAEAVRMRGRRAMKKEVKACEGDLDEGASSALEAWYGWESGYWLFLRY
jgi:hypothetical protein